MRYQCALFPLCAIIALFLSASACADTAVAIDDQVTYSVSTGDVSGVTDDKIATSWAPAGDGAELTMTFPADGAGYVRIDWGYDSTGYEFTQYASDGSEISTRTEQDSYAGITHLFPIDPGAHSAVLRLTTSGQKICRVDVYSKGDLPDNVMNFDGPCDKCDLMVVSAHEDDEFLFFGGVIPYYNDVRGKKVEVVYMANCGRLRRGEALKGLWAAGVRHYPDFINLKDKRVKTMGEGVALWGGKDAMVGKLVARIRRYKPEVIVTHDLDGEYGHNQHKITARTVEYAVTAAADSAQYPDSYDQYGAWQVKKLYLHLLSEDVIDFDWNVPYAALGGRTPLEVARAGYAEHVSQQSYYQVEDGGAYDNALFGLAYSTVGEDEKHDDFFEHIDGTASPAPSASPTPLPTLAPSPSATVAPLSGDSLTTGVKRFGLIFAGGLALLVLLSGAQKMLRKRGRK